MFVDPILLVGLTTALVGLFVNVVLALYVFM